MAVDIVGDGFPLSSKGSIVTHDGSTPAILTTGTDGQILTAQSTAPYGLVWSTPNTSSSGEGFFSIAASILTANAASVEFTSITSGYKDLELRCFYKTDGTANDYELQVQVNSITSGYSTALYRSTGSAISSSVASTSLSCATIGISLGSAETDWSASIVVFPNYANTSMSQRLLIAYGGYDKNTAGKIDRYSGFVASSSAISSIKIYSNNSKNLLSGSMFCLYGRKV